MNKDLICRFLTAVLSGHIPLCFRSWPNHPVPRQNCYLDQKNKQFFSRSKQQTYTDYRSCKFVLEYNLKCVGQHVLKCTSYEETANQQGVLLGWEKGILESSVSFFHFLLVLQLLAFVSYWRKTYFFEPVCTGKQLLSIQDLFHPSWVEQSPHTLTSVNISLPELW